MVPFTIRRAAAREYAAGSYRAVDHRIHGIRQRDGTTLALQWSGETRFQEVRGPELKERAEPIPVTTVAVPADRLGGIDLLRRWFRYRIELYATDLTLLANVPGAADGRVTLLIARRDRLAAEELVASARLAMADAQLYRADAPPELPPG